MLETIQALDSALLLQIQDTVRTSFLDELLVPISRAGDFGILWGVPSLLFLAHRRTRPGGAVTLCGLTTEYVTCEWVLKPLIHRPRPFLVLEELVCLVPPESSASLPSGHAASSFTCAYLLTRSFGKKGALAYIPAVIIAISRVYVGVHYLSDVLAGMALGTLVGAAVWAARRLYQKKHFLNKQKGKYFHV